MYLIKFFKDSRNKTKMIKRLADVLSDMAHVSFVVNSLLSPDNRPTNYLEWDLITQNKSSVHVCRQKVVFLCFL